MCKILVHFAGFYFIYRYAEKYLVYHAVKLNFLSKIRAGMKKYLQILNKFRIVERSINLMCFED